MDARRLLIISLAILSLDGCAALSRPRWRPSQTTPAASTQAMSLAVAPASAAMIDMPVAPPPTFAVMAPIPNPTGRHSRRRRGLSSLSRTERRPSEPTGLAAIAAANSAARETSRAEGFVGGMQVFAYEPGRVYEVWTAPLRVTTLTLSPGETVVSKAAGDTVRWQIGETQSGEGPNRRAHVMIKPLQRGLETNLVLATNRRIYLVQLRSGAPDAFNAVVTWDGGAVRDDAERPATAAAAAEPGPVTPQAPLDARFRITAKGRRPSWAPTAVMTDGVHTFLTFPPSLASGETPALFVVGPDGEPQLVNYRQQAGLWVVDRVLDAAELRLGGRKAQVVHIERLGGSS